MPGSFGMPVFPVASEPAGLWTWSDDFRVFPPVKSLALRSGVSLRELVLPVGWEPPDGGSYWWDTGAMIRDPAGEALFVGDRKGQLVLQKFPPLPLLSATSTWVALREPSTGRVLLFRR
jgi:hypothetical protein